MLQALTFLNQNLQLDQVANDESNFPYSQTHKNSGIVAAIDCEQFLENKTDLINDDLVCQKTQEYNKNYQLEFPDLEQIKKEKSENKGDPENKSPSKAEQWNKGLQQADKDRGIRLNYQGELRAYLKRLKFKIESNGDNLRIVDSDKRLVLSIKLSEKDGKTSTDITFAPGEATDKKAIKASLLVRLAYGDFNPSPYSAEPALSLKIPESSEVSYIEAMKELNYIFRQKIFNDENVNISYGSAPSPKPSFDPSSLPGFG